MVIKRGPGMGFNLTGRWAGCRVKRYLTRPGNSPSFNLDFYESEEDAKTNRNPLLIALWASPAKKAPFCKKIVGISSDQLSKKI
jgi:hypothetical protein